MFDWSPPAVCGEDAVPLSGRHTLRRILTRAYFRTASLYNASLRAEHEQVLSLGGRDAESQSFV
jgi:hypothetical protein